MKFNYLLLALATIAVSFLALTYAKEPCKLDHAGSSPDLAVLNLGFDAIKQLEKLRYDKKDIKETDMYKFKIVCSQESFMHQVDSMMNQKFRSEVNQACDIILSL
jgi:hypothetical protein